MSYEHLLATAFAYLEAEEREKANDWLDRVDDVLATLRADLSNLGPSNLDRAAITVLLYRQAFQADIEAEPTKE